MDLFEAMKAHAEWKVRFRTAVVNKDKLDAASISSDSCCALGKWLHGASKIKFGRLRSHTNCVARHALFHKEAGKIARLTNERKYQEAEAMMDINTSFHEASRNLALALAILKKECEDGRQK